MGDPVIVASTGWTFERSCIQACIDLGLAPPDLVLIHNTMLKFAILNGCDYSDLPSPLPVLPEAARALVRGLMEACEHAAAAFFSLAMEDDNRVTIGALGTISPLLSLFACPSTASTYPPPQDAGKALHYLSLADPNRVKIVQTSRAVHVMLAMVTVGTVPNLARLAMMAMSNVAACGEGQSALMDVKAVAEVVRLMKNWKRELKEHYSTALYGMSRDQLRFPGLARKVGAEQVLMQVAEGGRW